MQVMTPEGQVLLRNNKLRWQALGGPPSPNEGRPGYERTQSAAARRNQPAAHQPYSLDWWPAPPHPARLQRSADGAWGRAIRRTSADGGAPYVAGRGSCGYRMAFKVLLLFKNMALRAETITASQLDQRLPVENPNDEIGYMARVLNDLLERLQDSFDNLKRLPRMPPTNYEHRSPPSVASAR